MTLATALTILGSTATGALALSIIWKKLVRPAGAMTRRIVHLVDALEACAPHIKELPEALPILLGIAEEFKPNDGASLKDAVARIENTVGVLACRMERYDARLGEDS